LKQERRLRVYENRVLRMLFGPKRDEVTGECREIHNEELNDIRFSRNIMKVLNSIIMIWPRHVMRVVGEGDAYRVMMGRPEEKATWETEASMG
jgi:hypothetical protein